ncbi:hypothetical protein Tco_0359884 [Tanacetum coccineum]
MADQRTMAELLRAPTEGYAEAIVVPPIPAEHFELKHSLINLVTSKQFFSFEKEDPHAHIRYFNKITSTLKYKDVPETSIKLMLFPFSIDGPARIWLDKEPPRSILTWDDLQCSPSLHENESFHFDVSSSPRPPVKAPDDDEIEPDTEFLTAKVVGDISELYVHVPNVLTTLPTLSPMFDTLLLFSSENDDNVFNHGILASNEEKSPHLLSHRGFNPSKIISDFSESPMMIYEEDIPILDVPIAPYFEASHARGFVLRSLELQSSASLWESNIQSYRLTANPRYPVHTKTNSRQSLYPTNHPSFSFNPSPQNVSFPSNPTSQNTKGHLGNPLNPHSSVKEDKEPRVEMIGLGDQAKWKARIDFELL